MQSIGTKCLRTLTLFAFVLAVSALASAQGTSGSLTGQVSDPTGAAVAGASVTLVNLGTNFQQTEKTNSTGIYLITTVEPGSYSLTIPFRRVRRI